MVVAWSQTKTSREERGEGGEGKGRRERGRGGGRNGGWEKTKTTCVN